MRTRTYVASFFALCAIAVWWHGRPSDRSTPTAQADTPLAQPDHTRAAPMMSVAEPWPTTESSEPPADLGLLGERAVADYQAFAVYPPWSRPATPAYANNIAWNPPMSTIELSIGPNGHTETEGGDEGQPRYTQQLQLDRLFAAPGEALTATLIVRRDTGEPVEFTAVGEVQVIDEDETLEEGEHPNDIWETVGSRVEFLNVADDPTRKTVRFVPSAIPQLAAKPFRARLVAHVKVPGFEPSMILEGFQYAAREPFVLLDKVADRIVDGSLEVQFDVEVLHRRPVAVFGLLSDAHGNQIAIYNGFFRPTQTGRQSMPMTFFGKAIRDANHDGPYTISAVHGQVKVDPDDDNYVRWGDPRSFSTRPYDATAFSDAEWHSPEKTETTARMKRALVGVQR